MARLEELASSRKGPTSPIVPLEGLRRRLFVYPGDPSRRELFGSCQHPRKGLSRSLQSRDDITSLGVWRGLFRQYSASVEAASSFDVQAGVVGDTLGDVGTSTDRANLCQSSFTSTARLLVSSENGLSTWWGCRNHMRV
jgi:hypothetical protein